MTKNVGIFETLIAVLNRIAEAEERSALANEKLLVAMAQATSSAPTTTPAEPKELEPPKSVVEVRDDTLTQKDVIAACKQLSQAINKQAVFKIFKEFGADSVKDLNEADYGKIRGVLIAKIEQEVLDHAKGLSDEQRKAIAEQFGVRYLTEPKDKLVDILGAIKEALSDTEDRDEV